jgi:hypothetical protein
MQPRCLMGCAGRAATADDHDRHRVHFDGGRHGQRPPEVGCRERRRVGHPTQRVGVEADRAGGLIFVVRSRVRAGYTGGEQDRPGQQPGTGSFLRPVPSVPHLGESQPHTEMGLWRPRRRSVKWWTGGDIDTSSAHLVYFSTRRSPWPGNARSHGARACRRRAGAHNGPHESAAWGAVLRAGPQPRPLWWNVASSAAVPRREWLRADTRWCNGSTSGFGPDSPGSNPGRVALEWLSVFRVRFSEPDRRLTLLGQSVAESRAPEGAELGDGLLPGAKSGEAAAAVARALRPESEAGRLSTEAQEPGHEPTDEETLMVDKAAATRTIRRGAVP